MLCKLICIFDELLSNYKLAKLAIPLTDLRLEKYFWCLVLQMHKF